MHRPAFTSERFRQISYQGVSDQMVVAYPRCGISLRYFGLEAMVFPPLPLPLSPILPPHFSRHLRFPCPPARFKTFWSIFFLSPLKSFPHSCASCVRDIPHPSLGKISSDATAAVSESLIQGQDPQLPESLQHSTCATSVEFATPVCFQVLQHREQNRASS